MTRQMLRTWTRDGEWKRMNFLLDMLSFEYLTGHRRYDTYRPCFIDRERRRKCRAIISWVEISKIKFRFTNIYWIPTTHIFLTLINVVWKWAMSKYYYIDFNILDFQNKHRYQGEHEETTRPKCIPSNHIWITYTVSQSLFFTDIYFLLIQLGV